jgi:hypothetical protein
MDSKWLVDGSILTGVTTIGKTTISASEQFMNLIKQAKVLHVDADGKPKRPPTKLQTWTRNRNWAKYRISGLYNNINGMSLMKGLSEGERDVLKDVLTLLKILLEDWDKEHLQEKTKKLNEWNRMTGSWKTGSSKNKNS